MGLESREQEHTNRVQNAEAKAISHARVKLITALGDLGVERLRSDPELAARAVENLLPSLVRRQENKDAVLEAALEDLRQSPPNEQDTASGNEKIEGAFLNRFERYAEEASTDELRARWGRVLATEVRRPGSVSNRVLRIVDEMDAVTATLFEALCKSQIDNSIPSCLVPALDVPALAKLLSADLIMDPGPFGLRRTFVSKRNTGGAEFWLCGLGDYAIGIPKSATIKMGNPFETDLLAEDEGKPSFGVYVLTDAGKAISLILEDTQLSVLDRLVAAFGTIVSPPDAITKYARQGETYKPIVVA